MTSVKDFGRVAVLMGGESSEREVSLMTGNNVLAALKDLGVDAVDIDVKGDITQRLASEGIDRAFIALHGPGGEDGVIQGMLEMLQIPYTGSGVAACALTLNKAFTKWVWRSNNIPTLEFILVNGEADYKKVVERLGLPLCVKPINEGSSYGVSRVNSPEEINKAIEFAKQFSHDVIIEPWIVGRELTVGVLNGEALPVIEFTTPHGYYDFETKYTCGIAEYFCPADISPALAEEIRDISQRAFNITGCHSWGRLDLMLDDQNRPWLLELNTVPGMTENSLVPKAAKTLGKSFQDCIYDILKDSVKHPSR